jgi:hypothetical protein
MFTCDAARDMLALEPTSTNPTLLNHLDDCPTCAAYGRRSQTLDVLLRAELRWEAPTTLTAQLLALAATAPALPPLPARPNRWYVSLIYALTVAVVAISLAVAWQLLSSIALQLGVVDVFTQLLALPGSVLQQITHIMPESRYAIELFTRVRDQLIWLLLVAIVWAALDRWNVPTFAPQRQVM